MNFSLTKLAFLWFSIQHRTFQRYKSLCLASAALTSIAFMSNVQADFLHFHHAIALLLRNSPSGRSLCIFVVNRKDLKQTQLWSYLSIRMHAVFNQWQTTDARLFDVDFKLILFLKVC